MNHLLYRTWLRFAYGRTRWHDRHFPPSFIFERHDDFSARCKWAGVDLTVRIAGTVHRTVADRGHLLLSGPSVNDIRDHGLLKKYPIMCVNGSPALLKGDLFEHYHVADMSFPVQFKEQFQRYAVNCGHLWIGLKLLKLLIEVSDPTFLRSINFCVYDDYRRPFRKRTRNPRKEQDCVCADDLVCFSKNLDKGIFFSPTVAFSALQLLYNLKYEKVHVFGLDLSNTGRFYVSEAGQTLDEHRERIFTEMALSATVFRESDRNLYNCSPRTILPESHMQRGDPNR